MKRVTPLLILTILAILILAGSGCAVFEMAAVSNQTTLVSTLNQHSDSTTASNSPSPAETTKSDPGMTSTDTTTVQTTSYEEELRGELKVHFINVGQADSILIQQGESAMLIDAGNNADSNLVVSYIEDQGIKKLDYVIGTHPHEDHIGGLDVVIKTFEIGKVIMPNATNTTDAFEDVLLAIQNQGLKITKAVAGNEYPLGLATVTILGPVLSSFDDLNDSSVVCMVRFGSTSFLFEGDAETASENAMISKDFYLDADVLKIGHHGSNSSTSSAFLDAVSPWAAVISVGQGNDYGHPTSQTLDRLKSAGIELYRTDLAGTILATSDGKSISFNVKSNYGSPGETEPAETTIKQTTAATTASSGGGSTETVYITETGSKYHRDGCRYLAKSKIEISKSEAIAQGYGPCSACDP